MVSMSARVGSIADNDMGGWYSYRSAELDCGLLDACTVLSHAAAQG